MLNYLWETGNQDTEKQTCKMEQPHSNLQITAPPWSVLTDYFSLFFKSSSFIWKDIGWNKNV